MFTFNSLYNKGIYLFKENFFNTSRGKSTYSLGRDRNKAKLDVRMRKIQYQ